MKHLFLLIFTLILCQNTYAQNEPLQPFESLGKTVKVLTLSNGKYNESFPNDSIMRVGSVLYNRNTGELVSVIPPDTLQPRTDVASRWLSIDPLAHKFAAWSPYNFVMNNPVFFIDPDGAEIDISNLSKEDRAVYEANIKILTSNKLFNAYYSWLINSKTVYHIKSGSGAGGSGSFNPKTKDIHSINDTYTLSQEMFHAFQSDLKVYDDDDDSVRETEGDLVSYNIASDISSTSGFMGLEWSDGTQDAKFLDKKTSTYNESVLGKDFDTFFDESVEKRIVFYKNREINDGIKAPDTYVQPNSHKSPIALKTAIKLVMENNAQNLTGPRLENGNYYSNKNE
jgi:hypothetical protein